MEIPLANIQIGDRMLVTVDNWFYAPDGVQYRAVYGTVKAVRTAEASLGVRPNGKSTNWYLEIGDMIVAGCQIHYMVKTSKVNFGSAMEHSIKDGDVTVYSRPCQIYNADEVVA